MSFRDTFFPGNPKRREELIRTHQQILDCVTSNIRCANILTDAVNEHCGSNLQHIEMRHDRPFKEIGELFMSRLRKIQEILEKIDQELKEKLHPEDYTKLRDAKEYSSDVFKTVRNAVHVVSGGILTLGAVVLAFMCIPMLASLLAAFACFILSITSSPWALLSFGVIVLGIDAIMSAIMGAVERKKNIQALEEHKELLKLIKPVSEQFTDAVYEIKFSLKHCKKELLTSEDDALLLKKVPLNLQ